MRIEQPLSTFELFQALNGKNIKESTLNKLIVGTMYLKEGLTIDTTLRQF
jgi:hypothetical protein